MSIDLKIADGKIEVAIDGVQQPINRNTMTGVIAGLLGVFEGLNRVEKVDLREQKPLYTSEHPPFTIGFRPDEKVTLVIYPVPYPPVVLVFSKDEAREIIDGIKKALAVPETGGQLN